MEERRINMNDKCKDCIKLDVWTKAILERINFEEDWLSLVDLTKEHVKMVFGSLRAEVLSRAAYRSLENLDEDEED